MAVTANQSQAEWLSDILAALGFSGGGVSPGTSQKVQGVGADQTARAGINPVIIAGYDVASANLKAPYVRISSSDVDLASSVVGLYTNSIPYLIGAGGALERGRAAKTDGSALGTVGVPASALHGWDGAGYSAGKVESATNPNLRVGIFNGATQASVFTAADGASLISCLRAAAYQMVYNGATCDLLRHANIYKPVSLGAGTAETTIWTPAGGKKFRLMGLLLTCQTAASTLTFKDNTGGTTLFTARGGIDIPIILSPAMSNGILSAAANNVLTVTRGTSCSLEGVIYGCEE